MPEMDGFAATRLIRERERIMVQDAPPIPIIALTANAFKGEQERCLAAGMTDYLSKPFDPIKLVRTIEAYLDRANPAGIVPPLGPPSRETTAADVLNAAPREPGPRHAKFQENGALPPIIDFESLLKRCLGNRDLPKKLLAKFHARLPEEVSQLASAVNAGDSALVASLAHRIKGAAANLSAEPLREVAAELEALGRGGDLEDADAWVAQLKFEGGRFLRDVLRLSAEKSAEWQHAGVARETSFGEIQCVS